jgi:hypothetical protein
MNIEQLKYPIGKYERPMDFTQELLKQNISDIASFPIKLREEVQPLTNEQLDTPYRPDGWTIRQVVHHCADSHMNVLIRIKLALTEDKPVVKPYYEERWAELADTKIMPVESSLKILEGIHLHWEYLLGGLAQEQLKRTFLHPEHNREFSIEECMALYAWHCNHHLAHVTALKHARTWK